MNLFKNLFSKPEISTLTITSSNGFHLRPVAQFVAKAKKFPCKVEASFHGKTVDAKAVNTLLSLNLEKTDSFTLTTKGKRAAEAMLTLTALFDTLMQEDKEEIVIQKKSHAYKGTCKKAQSISSGIAIAPLHKFTQTQSYTHSGVSFQKAITLATEELDILCTTTSGDNAEIALAQKELLASLVGEFDTFEIFEKRIYTESEALKGGKMEAKGTDYLDILQRVKKHLGYKYEMDLPKTAFILLADDLLPSDIHMLEHSSAKGIILKKTSSTSHTAILLRASAIPSLILDEDLVPDNIPVILDADASVLITSPTPEDLEKANIFLSDNKDKNFKAYEKRFQSAQTKAGKTIQVFANISDVDSAKIAKEEGAEGIGLLRTEFLFDSIKPTVEEQTKAYKKIFSLFSNITVRTLDIGGDKSLPYVQLPHENNPFLGIRGVRLFKTHPELLEEQLLAILLASKDRAVKIMFPMIATVDEFIEAKKFAHTIATKHDLGIAHIQFGMMIEVPSVLFLIEDFNKVVDFYSIGTNDLTQYLFAIERTHPTLKTDTLSPVVFTVLEKIVKESTKPLSICGELASDTQAIPKLLSLGLKTLSVSSKGIAQTKECIRYTQITK
jgi:phosphocarrier protein FPr